MDTEASSQQEQDEIPSMKLDDPMSTLDLLRLLLASMICRTSSSNACTFA
jgi:hypothetical protein